MIRRIVTCLVLMALLAPIGLLVGCDKVKEEDCKRAIANIRKLYGTQNVDIGVTPRAMVRSCRGNASEASVECFINAKSLEDLSQCEGDFAKAVGGAAQSTDHTSTADDKAGDSSDK